ncbi:MAG: ABC transporter ATP-binding protein/permease [Coriobacteriales bacterium]|jgi:ABC-type lipoprotein export system ATPase subunit/ABC-type antimicrobial peptide transport system permease subunit|nr:ABC transporter ATP-binding protein/permease [Coriobacteriales bacterium]
MLQLTDIRKTYHVAGFEQIALDGVSIAFRDNEFVAILGPSGSGKTTMLNIVGGLDHYDTGDLVIDGTSTRQYRDRDWDTYRNNRIGFVFQSYNLIPHQTVLVNVELALTLSGVSRTERRERARQALAEVGLEEHINKKPTQLSGGQMQRVAVARALINDPEILLADEPTGALDSKTSVQIMDLLVKIAADRLVVMVTHNPELAEHYANRIVNLRDGQVVSDSNPYDPAAEAAPAAKKQPRRTKMSFFTALALSFNNLMTKKGRTLMTSFAGSIGIIGIAAILALATGVNNYIKTVEEETLSIYPLSINKQGMDLTSMLVMSSAGSENDEGGEGDGDAAGAEGSSTSANKDADEDDPLAKIINASKEPDETEKPTSARETRMLTTMFNSVKNNDLRSLKTFLDEDGDGIGEYVNSIHYSYNVTPQIFAAETTDDTRQVNPNRSFARLGLGGGGASSSLMSMSMSTDVFSELIDDPSLYIEQYDIVAGHLPESSDELILVLNPMGGISDLVLYMMGLRDPDELADMVDKFADEENVVTPDERLDVPFEDILDVRFKLVEASRYYQYDSEFNIWKDMRDDKDYMRKLVEEGRELRIVGVLQSKPEASVTMLSPLIYYPASLTSELMEDAAESAIVKAQMEKPKNDVFSGKTFDELNDEAKNSQMDLSSLFSVDEEKISGAFGVDQSALALDPSALQGLGSLDIDPNALPQFDMPQMDLAALLADTDIEVDNAKVAAAMSQIMSSYFAWASDPANGINVTDPNAFSAGFLAYVQVPTVQIQIAAILNQAIDINQVQGEIQKSLGNYIQSAVTTYMQAYMQVMMQAMQAQVSSAMTRAMTSLATSLPSAMSFDQQIFMEAFQLNLTQEELTRIMLSAMGTQDSSYDNNMQKLGYASFSEPSSIDIFPIDFESKERVLTILDNYNERMKDEGADDRVITYTDIVGTLMASVTTIIDMISTMLIAFVTISLVVSSIMIGVITYISVLERKKEIGILRAMGASKGNIANVFNAETLIVGLVAGALGIGITLALSIPANFIVLALTDVPNIAILPWQPALFLVLVSMALCLLAGLLPSSAASRRDPVEALRSE